MLFKMFFSNCWLVMMPMKQKNKLLCSDCAYFFVTYETHKPWGCRHFGFKSKKLPAQVVTEASGTNCASKVVMSSLGQQKRKLADGR
jgi:ribosomal protein L37AE/L43A